MKKLTPQVRYAYYIIYDKKCSYCSKQILYENLEIDHIIPLSLNKNPQKLKKLLDEIKKTYPLAPDFSLKNHLNLLPACKNCNAQKRDSTDIDHIVNFLTKAKRKNPALLECIKKINQSSVKMI
jgi:5-methylcytosine-specific restriction endonuclease McrA